MNSTIANWLSGLILLGLIVIGALWYPKLPTLVASHWDAAGNVNGYLSREWAVALPVLMVSVLWALFAAIPRIDPLRANFRHFAREYHWLQVGVLALLAAIFVYANNLGLTGTAEQVAVQPILAAVGLLFAGIGLMLPKIKRNYFVGIRTPWTLESDSVWNETHRRSGPVWIGAGILATLSALWPAVNLWILGTSLASATLYSLILSYVLHRQQTAK